MTSFIDKEVGSLLNKELVYVGESPYAAKLRVAPKDTTWRMCINYRGINKRTVDDKYPLPDIEGIYN